MAAERIIGIDFGTSTSFVKVKRYIDGQPFGGDRFETKAVVFDGKGSIAVPTVVQQAGDKFWFGYDAEIIKPSGIIYNNFKVDLESADPEVQTLAKEMTLKFFEYIYEKYDEQRQFFGDLSDSERTLVSYPAKWREETRRFMVEAAQKAGFANVTGMDEATAAINAVMIQESPFLQEKGYLRADIPVTFLLIDMGAGTTDLAVCRYTMGETSKNEILATWPSDNEKILFGGREVDELLCNMLTEQLSKNGMMEAVVASLKKLRMGEIKSWKEYTVSDRLNSAESVESCSVLDGLYMLMGMNPPPFPAIDRQSFEEMAQSYLKQYANLVNGCIEHTANTVPDFQGGENIDLVILTGGHSQWYFARDVLTGELKNLGEVGLPGLLGDGDRVLRIARPQETVSLGLVYTAMLPQIKPEIQPAKAVPAKKAEVHTDMDDNNEQYVYGNTCGNIINGGHVAQQDNWVFYQSASNNDQLYKMHPDGTEKTKLGYDMIENISVAGQWIYYNKYHKGIYKMRSDGKKEIQLCSDAGTCVNVIGSWIYYSNDGSGKTLCKRRTDGSKKTILSEDSCKFVNVVDNWIYYQNLSDGGKLYKIHTDGTEKVKLCDDICEEVNVSNGWVYYSNGSDSTKLYKMRTDGSKRTKLCEDMINYINVAGNWIYYSNGSIGGKLYKIRTDGSEKTKLCDDKVSLWINVAGDWVYYEKITSVNYLIAESNFFFTYRIRTDGTNKQLMGKSGSSYMKNPLF